MVTSDIQENYFNGFDSGDIRVGPTLRWLREPCKDFHKVQHLLSEAYCMAELVVNGGKDPHGREILMESVGRDFIEILQKSGILKIVEESDEEFFKRENK